MSFGYQTLGFGSYPNRSSGSGSSIAQGLTPSLLTLTGQSQTSSSQVANNNSIDLSNVGGVDYTGESARLVFHHVKGDHWTGDLQILNINFGGTTYGNSSSSFSFQTTVYNSGFGTLGSATYADALTNGFSNVTGSASGGRWVRDAYGTGSGNTGLTLSNQYYFYTETSSPVNTRIGYNFWLRSPVTALSFNNRMLSFQDGRYGSGIGTLNVYLDIQ